MSFNAGASSIILDIYDSIRDVKINNNTMLMLSKHKKLNDIFLLPEKTADKKKLYNFTFLKTQYIQQEYNTAGFFRENGVLIQRSIVHKEGKQTFRYINSTNNDIIYTELSNSEEGLFKLIFTDDYVFLVDRKNCALTQDGSSLYFTAFEQHNTQKFHYILNDVSIMLFEYDTQYNNIIIFDNILSKTYLQAVDSNIPLKGILYIEDNKNINDNLFVESFIAKYKTNALSSVNNVELDQETQSLPYEQEYLVNIPYKNNTPTIYINSLKNYQTSTYEYSLSNNKTKRREYTNIFAGNNKNNGHKNIYLNYFTDTLEKTFKTNTETVFHYPGTVPTSGVYLSAAGLIEDGAIAGSNPFTADRVGYNRSDYRELNLPAPSSVISDNTWQYAWLSAGDSGQTVWIDRHYLGAYYEPSTQDYLLYKVRDPLIIDIPSTMLLLPNRIYSYYHQGFDNIKKYTSNFNSINRDKSGKILEVTDWGSTLLQDSSIFKNNGSICLNTTPLQSEYLQLDGTNYAVFPATESLSEGRQLTIGFWFKAENWSQFEGNQIFGNFSAGGCGLFNKQNISTALFTIYDSSNRHVYNLNSQLNLIGEQGISYNSTNNNLPVYIMRASDYSYWLINSNNLNALKYDLNNNKLLEVNLSYNIKTISQVEMDGDENIYVLDNSTKTIVKFNSYTGEIFNNEFQGAQSFNLTDNFNRIEIVKNYDQSQYPLIHRQGEYRVIGIYAEHSTVDNNNNVWSSIGVNLYKNNNLFANIGAIEQIIGDTKNNIWVLHDKVFVTKINSNTNNIISTIQVSKILIKQKLFINLITTRIDDKDKDYLIVLCSGERLINIINIENDTIEDSMYLLSLPSIFLSKQNLNKVNINLTAYGDFSGYQLQRKFNISQELVWKINVSAASKNTENKEDYKVLKLPFITDNFEKGWHYFTLVFDHAAGYTAAYVDGTEISRINFKPFEYIITPTNRPFCIGAVTTAQGILNDSIGINDKNKTIGSIAKLHVYGYAFDKHDVNCLFKSTFFNMYKDMTWNINIGNRNYIEQIERFFKHTMPGNKSNYYNLKIKNFPATEEQKIIIEQAIKDTIKKIAPADTTLNKIKWEY